MTSYAAQYGDDKPAGMDFAKRVLRFRSEFVLFVDILGFADLVEEHDQIYLDWAQHETHIHRNIRQPPPSPLLLQFTRFHEAMKSALSALDQRRPPAIVFSDSMFVVEHLIDPVLDLARTLMRQLIIKDVPVRMGIGFGTFEAPRFSTDTQRSRTHHISEFYGTAVVRAHRAESCGITGLRILLHPSVSEEIARRRLGKEAYEKPVPSWQILPLPVRSPKYDVQYELNYLTAAPEDDDIARHVKRMGQRAPDNVQNHYTETDAALRRMSDALRV